LSASFEIPVDFLMMLFSRRCNGATSSILAVRLQNCWSWWWWFWCCDQR